MIAGGLLQIAGFGAGAISVDNRLANRREAIPQTWRRLANSRQALRGTEVHDDRERRTRLSGTARGLALDIALQGHLLPPLVSGPTDQRLA